MAGQVGGAPRKSLKYIKDEVEYYDHQVQGIRKMANMGSLLLCDEMGLGKSLQALTVAAIDFERTHADALLIIAPASLKWNWLAEIERFTNFRAVVLDGPPKKRQAQLDEFDAEVLIVNYEQVEPHLAWLRTRFQTIIMDECHYIKGHKSKRTKACHALVARRFMLLTGSPVLNHVDDLWSLLHTIDPTEYPNYWRFVQRYAVFGGFKDKQIIGVKNAAELNGRVQARMLRRHKKDVLDLPEKQRIPVIVPLHPLQQKLYDQAVDDLFIDLPDDPNPMELENALTKMLRLKQICGTSATIPGYDDRSYNLTRAVEMILDLYNEGEHVVVFTQFRGVLQALAERLAAVDVEYEQLHGDVPTNQRLSVVARWSQGKPMPLLAMLQVAGVGLNMTVASKCIFLDKLFAPKLNEQAEDRLHRIGADETKPIEIFHIYCKGTVEDRVEQILRTKSKTFNDLVEESDWKKRLIQAMREEDEDD